MGKKEQRPLLALGTAYKSLRDSGFDFSTAVGEPVDNSIQAGADRIEIKFNFEKVGKKKIIKDVFFFDNGCGMDEEVLHGCLQLGFSSRYNDRQGIGRFGVGATLASISQCKRVTVYSSDGSKKWYFNHIDLDEIESGKQDGIVWPQEYSGNDPIDLKELKHGTVMHWSKCDRLSRDANGNPLSAKTQIESLKKWLGRTYRKYIMRGVNIIVDGESIFALDPLYIYPEYTKFPKDEKSTIKLETSIDWPVPNSPNDKSKIEITITLLPESLRPKRGSGGSEAAKERLITENEGISVLRNDREVAYGNFYPMTPSSQNIDRFWGCEISFQSVLDECWKVRNVKRGARPTLDLSDKINEKIDDVIKFCRKEIKSYWKEVDAKEKNEKGVHNKSEDLVAKAEQKSKPSVEAGKGLSEKEKEEKLKEVIDEGGFNDDEKETLKKKVSVEKNLPISITSKAMSGSEFMETDHMGDGKIILTFNRSHPFFSDIYSKLENLEESSDPDIAETALQIRSAVDLLLMAYGRAESMIEQSSEEIEEAFSELRSYWGIQLRKYLSALTKEK